MTGVEPILVNPTATQKGEHTDIALTALYNAHVSLINSERQATWQRFNIMLLANSLLIGLMSQKSELSLGIVIGMLFGLVLCFLWWKLIRQSYLVFNMYADDAMRFFWPKYDGTNLTYKNSKTNPVRIHSNYENREPGENQDSGGKILAYAQGVIALFALGYAVFGVSAIIRLGGVLG
jgi:hypothetical protein